MKKIAFLALSLLIIIGVISCEKKYLATSITLKDIADFTQKDYDKLGQSGETEISIIEAYVDKIWEYKEDNILTRKELSSISNLEDKNLLSALFVVEYYGSKHEYQKDYNMRDKYIYGSWIDEKGIEHVNYPYSHPNYDPSTRPVIAPYSELQNKLSREDYQLLLDQVKYGIIEDENGNTKIDYPKKQIKLNFNNQRFSSSVYKWTGGGGQWSWLKFGTVYPTRFLTGSFDPCTSQDFHNSTYWRKCHRISCSPKPSDCN